MKEKEDNIAVALGLKKPIIVFDLETTGLSLIKDRIVELAYYKYFPDGRVEQADMLINPEMSIPPEVTAVHGLTDDDVKDQPTFQEKSNELWQAFNDCYYSGFNVVRFDLPLLRQEFLRCGKDFSFHPMDIIDAKVIYHAMEPRTLSAAYKHYCHKEHEEAHEALGDVKVTAEIITEQIKLYGQEAIQKIHEDTLKDYVDVEARFYREAGEIYFAFSKFKDRSLSSVAKTDPTFLRWILQADFSEDSKNVVRDFLKNNPAN